MSKFIFALPKEQGKKKNKKEKFHTLFFHMTWSTEIKSNAVFMYDTSYTYDMYNYNIKCNIELFYNNKV